MDDDDDDDNDRSAFFDNVLNKKSYDRADMNACCFASSAGPPDVSVISYRYVGHFLPFPISHSFFVIFLAWPGCTLGSRVFVVNKIGGYFFNDSSML